MTPVLKKSRRLLLWNIVRYTFWIKLCSLLWDQVRHMTQYLCWKHDPKTQFLLYQEMDWAFHLRKCMSFLTCLNCSLPPKLTKVCCPMQLRWAPVSIKKVELPVPVMWKLTVVRPDLLFEFLRPRELMDLSDWLCLVLGECGDLYFLLEALDLISGRSQSCNP